MIELRLLVVSEASSRRDGTAVLVGDGHVRRFSGYGPRVALTWTITERADRGGLSTPLPPDIDITWLPGFTSTSRFLAGLPKTTRALWTSIGAADAVLVNVPSFPAIPALIIARLRGKPAIALQVARWAQLRVGPGVTARSTLFTRILTWLGALAASVLMVQGDAMLDELPRRARRKAVLVTLSSLDANDIVEELDAWAPHEPVRLVTVARLIRTKRVDLVIDAIAELRRRGTDARLVVAGDGPERAAIEAHLDATGTREAVELLGWVDDAEEVHRRLREADVFAFTSEDEGLPLAVLEAMAVGTPVVATAAGGLATFLVDGVNSLVVPNGDAGAVADAVQRCLADRELTQRLRTEAVARVRPLTRQAFVSQLIDVALGEMSRQAAS